MARKKTVGNNLTIKRKAVRKRTVNKKDIREKQQIIAEKAMDAVRK